MYKLSRRKNLTPFLLLVAVGLAVAIGVPPQFPDQVFECPAFALFPAEIALVMMLSVLFFENATPSELLRLSFTMLAIIMVQGSFCNIISKSSQTLPDQTLLINWVQLICMNISGLIATVALYQTKAPAQQLIAAPREPAEKRASALEEATTAAALEAAAEKLEAASGESVKDILDKLDVSRINRLEKAITKERDASQGSVSLDSLFADESHAANAKGAVAQTPEAEVPAISKDKASSLDSLLHSQTLPKPNLDEPPSRSEEEIPAPPAPPKAEPIPAAPIAAAAFADAAASIDDLFGDIAIGDDAAPAPTDAPKFEIPTPTPVAEAAPAAVAPEAASEAPAPSPAGEAPAAVAEATADTTPVESTVFSLDDSLFNDTGTDSEPVAAAAPVVSEPTPAAAAPATAGLFDESNLGGELEDIFGNLAGGAADDTFSPEKLAEIKAHSAPVEEPAPVPAPKAEGKLFGDDLGNDLDSIFDNLAPEAANKDISELLNKDLGSEPHTPAAQPAAAEAVAEAKPAGGVSPAGGASTGKEVKEFGRLSSAATAKSDLAAPGTLKTIGQMLLDTQAVENIIKRSENRSDEAGKITAATARVVTVSRGADIQAMLNNVAAFPGIDGSLVIGKDGLLIGATESLGMMRDVLGVLALGMQSTTNLGTKKADLGELRQAIFRTGEKVTIVTEIGIGILACFSDQWKLEAIDAVLDHISSVINESQASGGSSLPTESLSAGMLGGEPAPAAAPAPAPVAPPPAPAPKPAPEVEVAIPISDAKGGLLSVNDDDIGGLFDSILSEPSTHNDALATAPAAAPAAPAPAPAPAPAAAAPAATAQAAPAADGGILSVDDDMMSAIFDNLLDKSESVEQAMDFSPPAGMAKTEAAKTESAPAAAAPAAAVAEAPAPAPAAASTPAPAAEPAPAATAPVEAPAAAVAKAAAAGNSGKQIKEFGRLSTSAPAANDSADGAIKAIGRQLIDVQAVENIIKAGEKREKMGAGLTTARVISAARGEGIKALLTKIDGCPGVQGSLIVGNDGLVIASTLQGGLDKDLLGALCTAMHSHTELASKRVSLGKLKQIIFHTHDRMTILTAVAVGVLAVFVDNHDMTQVDSLLTAIETTVSG